MSRFDRILVNKILAAAMVLLLFVQTGNSTPILIQRRTAPVYLRDVDVDRDLDSVRQDNEIQALYSTIINLLVQNQRLKRNINEDESSILHDLVNANSFNAQIRPG